MSKLLPNLPIECLTIENDYIGIIEKGNLLKSFFLHNKHEFSQMKIFSIYGEWGSGKSTLMKYLEKELQGSFNTFFFESWEFESDENLSLSLLETLTNKNKTKFKKIKKELLETGSRLLEGFARSMTMKAPGLNISGDKLIEIVKEEKELTFLELKEKFKEDFIKWENKITTEDKSPDYNIIFIDDLDRCEPENILNLLSAMKLFFTYGKKTIFLCGIDKKAIREAVKTKYGEIVKANEYLEKVFDISFSMPESVDVSKLVKQYFNDDEIVEQDKLGDLVSDFFEKLHFRNPRRIKKILNKYLIIKRMKEIESSDNLDLPNIIYKGAGTLFETYLTLYLLILNEFEPKNFKLLFDLNSKRKSYYNALKRTYVDMVSIKNASYNTIDYISEKTIDEPLYLYNVNSGEYYFTSIILSFSPVKVDILKNYSFSDQEKFITNFNLEFKSFDYYFTLFIFENEAKFRLDFKKIKISLLSYKKMISNLI
jgi:hypothetical protein